MHEEAQNSAKGGEPDQSECLNGASTRRLPPPPLWNPKPTSAMHSNAHSNSDRKKDSALQEEYCISLWLPTLPELPELPTSRHSEGARPKAVVG